MTRGASSQPNVTTPLAAWRKLSMLERLERIQDMVEADDGSFELFMSEAGVALSGGEPKVRAIRRRWSELEPFDRKTFDHNAYLKSLDE